MEVQADRSLIWRPLQLYGAIGGSVAFVAFLLAWVRAIPLETAFGIASASLLISLSTGLILGVTWALRGCRMSYVLGDRDLVALRGSRTVARCNLADIVDLTITEPMDWGDLLFSYPWPRFPYLWVELRSESGLASEVSFPRIAIWGESRVAQIEAALRQNLGLNLTP